ncbi:MAG: acriflavine resistance protein B [Lysobacteraceae bacterium]|nr:MAG: acriflavine resistance protein B [Xanthomonadaceae bacterium]
MHGIGGFSAPFIRRPIATMLLMIGMAFIGAISYWRLPVAGVPQVDIPTIQVNAAMPGANAETVATSITAPLERTLAQVPGVVSMASTSQEGVAAIVLELDLNRDIDDAAFDVQAAINAAANDLPRNLPYPPTFEKVHTSDAKMLTIAMYSDAMTPAQISDLAQNQFAAELSRIKGVGQVYFHGLQRPAIRIQVDPARLASLGLDLETVRARIAASTVNSPKGSLHGPRSAVTIDSTSQLVDPEAYRTLVIAERDGRTVRLADVAKVISGVENARTSAWVQGRQAVTVEIRRQPGFNIVETVDRIKAALPAMRENLPASVQLRILGDRTKTIRASIRDLQWTLGLTIVLVVLVVWAFLGSPRAALIPSLAIPISLLGTLIATHLLGYTLNNVSLMALTIVIGFVVDDAIVMIENILRHVEQGEPPLQASLKGAREIGFTIVSMTVSLVAVFIPLLFMDGLVGRLFREFAVTATIAILISGLVSLTLTPMLSSRMIDPGVARMVAHAQNDKRGPIGRMSAGYANSLRWALDHPRLMLGVTLVALAATVVMYRAVPKGFFPKQDNGMINGVTEAARDISYPAMIERMKRLSDVVAQDPDVRDVYYYVEGNPAVNMGRLLIDLKPLQERDASVYEVIKRLRERADAVPGISMHLQARQDIQVGARISKTQYQYTVRHADIETLEAWVPGMMRAMEQIPAIEDLNNDLEPPAPRLKLDLDRDAMARYGIVAEAIDETLYDAFGQRQVASYYTQTNVYRVILEVDPRHQMDESALAAIQLLSPSTGRLVPLGSVARIERTMAPLTINHDGQFPAVTFSFNLAPGHALGQAVDAIRDKADEIGSPAGLSGVFQGTAQAFNESLATQPLLIMAAVLAIYIVLGVLYESVLHPLIIVSTLPSAGVGAIGALMLLDQEFSLIALIGVILLIGIVKKNGIMMLDFALDAEREQGLAPREAIYQACLIRFRPIMMTTMAALLGGLPLALDQGVGAELRRPLGITMVGGLLVSQILTLYTTPIVYLYLSKLQRSKVLRFRSRLSMRPRLQSEPDDGAGASGALPESR